MGVLKQGEDRVFSPVKGTYVHLKDVSDATFNSGVLGTGFAVDPEEDVIHAPVEGTISAVFPTGHALSLIHISKPWRNVMRFICSPRRAAAL